MVFALKVIAPATLDEGYSFDATVDGRTFRVKVPEGGVQAGEEFVVRDSQEIVAASINDAQNEEDAPHGRWRTSIFSCFETLLTSTFWMAFLCPVIQTAQLQTRFHLSCVSRDAPPQMVHRTFIASMLVFLVFWTFLVWYPQPFILYLLFYIFIQTRLRRNARRRYDIPGNLIIDLFHTLFCSCCSTIQMVRHTHDEKEYPYDGCATDGLPLYAPPLEHIEDAPAEEGSAGEGCDPDIPPTDEITEVTVQATVV